MGRPITLDGASAQRDSLARVIFESFDALRSLVKRHELLIQS